VTMAFSAAEHRRGEDRSGTKLFRPVSRSDFFPKLIALQKSAHARHSVIYKLNTAGLPNRRKLFPVLDSFTSENREAIDDILAAHGQAMLEHLDQSTLPLMFNGASDEQSAEAPDFVHFVARLKGRTLPFSGVCFPVRLGSMGNGYMVFTANYLDLTSETIIDIHQRAHLLMKDLLSLDERRTTPSEVLSPREIACLQMAGDGMISEEIADKLGLSVHTVNAYLSTATTKLDSVNRIQAIAKAIRLGYIA
jgi:DNA-binding CsgD family transcriptional regulator